MATSSISLQQCIDSAELPTLVLDFRLPQYLDDPSKVPISNIVVSHNAACQLEKFQDPVQTLLAQRLGNGRLNTEFEARDPIIGAHTERHVIGKDIWTCSGLGSYRIWTLQPEGESASGIDATNKKTDVENGKIEASTKGEVLNETSREQQLFNKLDHIHGPLKAFCHLADQALSDVQKAIKDLSNPGAPSPSQKIHSHLHPIELNLRTLSSGLSLLKDLSDISSLTPEPTPPSTTPKELPSDQDLLSKILSRVHPPLPDPYAYRTSQLYNNYTAPANLEPYMPTLRAVLIEDNRINQRLLGKFTQKLSVLPEYISQAFNGAEGLEIIEEMVKRGNFPDIILVDSAMPVMDGFEFLREFRKRYPGRRTRIVGMTAQPMLGDTRMEKLGANCVIAKPLRFHLLQREMESAANLKLTREIEFRGRL